MTDKTSLGISLLAVAFVGGALGDALLRATPWGLNLFVWIAALVAAVTVALILYRVESAARSKMRSQAGNLLAAGVADYAFSVLASHYNALAGAGYLIGGDIQWKEIPRDGWTNHLAPVANYGFIPSLLLT